MRQGIQSQSVTRALRRPLRSRRAQGPMCHFTILASNCSSVARGLCGAIRSVSSTSRAGLCHYGSNRPASCAYMLASTRAVAFMYGLRPAAVRQPTKSNNRLASRFDHMRPNQAPERTATRFAFTLCVAKTFSLRATGVPGGRRSAWSR